jgi:hypothetical protein
MIRYAMFAASFVVALSGVAAAQDAPPPEANRLFMLKVAQAVDDRCHLMPPETRREFDGRIAQLAETVSAKVGAATVEQMSRAAPARAKANGTDCDDRTRRFLEGSFAQSAPPPAH